MIDVRNIQLRRLCEEVPNRESGSGEEYLKWNSKVEALKREIQCLDQQSIEIISRLNDRSSVTLHLSKTLIFCYWEVPFMTQISTKLKYTENIFCQTLRWNMICNRIETTFNFFIA